MNDIVIFAIILIGVGVLFIAKTIIIVSQSDIYVVERLGKFSRELNAGLHIINRNRLILLISFTPFALSAPLEISTA
jgi:regulator of protease activity HflC (stomatin/prohibitin superfamily)